MPAFVAALLGGLISIVGSLVGRVLVSLGLSVVTYTGFNATINWLKSQALSSVNAMGADVVGMLSVLNVGTAINIVFSAMLARLVLQGLTGDTVKNLVRK